MSLIINLIRKEFVQSNWVVEMLLGDVLIVRKIQLVLFASHALKKEIILAIVFSWKEMLGGAVIVEILKLGMKHTSAQIIKGLIISIRNKLFHKCLNQLKINPNRFSKSLHRILNFFVWNSRTIIFQVRKSVWKMNLLKKRWLWE